MLTDQFNYIKPQSSWDVLGPLNDVSKVSPSLKVLNDIGVLTRLGFSSGFSSTLSEGSVFLVSLAGACQEISTSSSIYKQACHAYLPLLGTLLSSGLFVFLGLFLLSLLDGSL